MGFRFPSRLGYLFTLVAPSHLPYVTWQIHSTLPSFKPAHPSGINGDRIILVFLLTYPMHPYAGKT